MDEEGMVSDMVYNFVLPEVERESARRGLRENEMSYLRAAHTSIYDEIINLPADELLSDEPESENSSANSLEIFSSCDESVNPWNRLFCILKNLNKIYEKGLIFYFRSWRE